MKSGLVSIITPSYNCGRFIAETIESVLAQTYRDWELIIVDDCSTDDTQEIVERYMTRDPRIRYHRLAANSGAAVARTEAMRMAEGEYMAFLDSDDLWMPDKLKLQLDFMKSNGYAFTCTSYEQISEDSEPTGRIVRSVPKTDRRRLLLDCPVGNSTVMYDVSAMGKFEVPDIRKRNDDALWLRMLRKEKYIRGMPDVLMRYRIRGGSISGNKLALVKYHWILYRKIERMNVFSSVFHICWWGFLKVFRIK
jgi:teichuronic acid biosynthesis glycosyltransferase TuaG